VAGDEFTFAVLTRPDLVPEGVEAVVLARFQELRMLLGVPRAAFARARASAFQPGLAGPDGVDARPLVRGTATAMGRRDRAIFKVVVPWSGPRAAGDRRFRADEA
jgi:hypothetical protein